MITEYDPLILRTLADIDDISRLSGHAITRHFAVNSIVNMGFMGSNQGLQLNTMIPQTLGRTHSDQLSLKTPLKLPDAPLRYM